MMPPPFDANSFNAHESIVKLNGLSYNPVEFTLREAELSSP
jgi:hypothetical protein